MANATVQKSKDIRKALQNAGWMALFKSLIIKTNKDLKEATDILEILSHNPDKGVQVYCNILADHISYYEQMHYPVPKAQPGEVLAYLMEAHDLNQSDLAHITEQSNISQIINGKRKIGLKLARKFAKYFHTSPDVFLSD